MALEELVRPAAALADDVPGILRAARMAHGKSQETQTNLAEPRPTILGTLQQFIEKTANGETYETPAARTQAAQAQVAKAQKVPAPAPAAARPPVQPTMTDPHEPGLATRDEYNAAKDKQLTQPGSGDLVANNAMQPRVRDTGKWPVQQTNEQFSKEIGDKRIADLRGPAPKQSPYMKNLPPSSPAVAEAAPQAAPSTGMQTYGKGIKANLSPEQQQNFAKNNTGPTIPKTPQATKPPQQKKIGAAELGERILLKRALRQYLAS